MMIKKIVRQCLRVFVSTPALIPTLSILTLLVACANNTGPVVIRDVMNTEKSPEVSAQESGTVSSVSKSETVGTYNQESRAKAQPVAPTQKKLVTQSPLKQQLLSNAEKKLAENKPQQAIILAERGLRIDRQDADFYWVLSSAYKQLEDIAQSSYFAQQGLRYTEAGSERYRSLYRLAYD